MRRLPFFPLVAVAIVALVAMSVLNGTGVEQSVSAAGACGLPQPAFCDTFSTTYNGGGRSGQLDPSRWSVTRQLAGMPNAWAASSLPMCDKNFGILTPDNDV